MERITCGAASATVDLGGDGIARASVRGLLLAGNAGPLSARVLRAGVDRGGIGLLVAVERALVALAPIDSAFYGYIPPELRDVPVAVLVSPAQWPIYAGIAPAAARRGAMRRAFLSRAEAEAWLREQAPLLSVNRAWWSLRR